MKEKPFLNDYEVTQKDSRNDIAKEHQEHKLRKIGINKHSPNKVPYLKTRVQKYLCEDCKVMFETYNTIEDKNKNKKDFLKDTYFEE